ncbi:hypothetical protein AVEN_246339-1 [Araneus ventricosus]|uniref:Uncharacterized protein n=1 Tax=Araneus ventricosus TaxID=182803 RepID=A0A4Y2PHQ1_ARAVE|nr:hypothetical protein AVEN_246339-1 [Araneus ventricosus]
MTRPKAFSGSVGTQLSKCEKLPVVNFESNECEIPEIERKILSKDQQYLLDISYAIKSGRSPEYLYVHERGPLSHSMEHYFNFTTTFAAKIHESRELVLGPIRWNSERVELDDFPCHTQAVERGVKLVTEASQKVVGSNSTDDFITTALLSRSSMPGFSSKSYFKIRKETEGKLYGKFPPSTSLRFLVIVFSYIGRADMIPEMALASFTDEQRHFGPRSFNVQRQVYLQLGSLHPDPGEKRRFVQFCVLDFEEAKIKGNRY